MACLRAGVHGVTALGKELFVMGICCCGRHGVCRASLVEHATGVLCGGLGTR